MGSVVFFFSSDGAQGHDILKAPVYFENDGSSRSGVGGVEREKNDFGTADIWQGL